VGIQWEAVDPDPVDQAGVPAAIYIFDSTAPDGGNAGGRFNRDSGTGIIYVNAAGPGFDYETAISHQIYMKVFGYDGSISYETATIDVLDVVEPLNATNLDAAEAYTEDTPLDLTDIVIDGEGAGGGNGTATLTLSDIAAGSLSTATSGAVTSTYAAGTGIWSASGALVDVNALLAGVTFNPTLNYNANFSIATSVDDGTTTLTGNKVVTGTAVNDPVGAIIDINALPEEVRESAPLWAKVGFTGQAIDPDGDTVTWSMDDDAGGRFGVDIAGRVNIPTPGTLDFETDTSHSVTLRATSSDGSFSTHTFTINVLDVGEANPLGPISDADPLPNEVTEAAFNGLPVGYTAEATDPDPVDQANPVIYTLDDDAGGRFNIGSGNGIVTVKDFTLLDYETAQSHDITIKATSWDYSTSFLTVTINLTPVNDNTPVADAESFTVLEGGTATEADLDAGTSLLDGDTDLDLPNDTLTVNTTPVAGPSFGALTLNADGTFSYTHDGSENFSDGFTYEVSDAVGNTDTAIVSITITPVNDAPSFVNLDATPTFVEDGPAVVLDANVTVTDPELDAMDDYTGATLQLRRNGGGDADDQYTIPTGGNLTVVGNDIIAGGNVIAVFADFPVTGLQIFFQDNGTTPTKALVDEVLQAVVYANTSDTPPASVLVDYTLSDGAGLAGNGSVTVTITPVNDAPSFINLDATPTFVEDGPAVVLDANATVTDPELDAMNDYTGATLTLARNGGANLDDQFTIPAGGSFTVAGNDILVGGDIIAGLLSGPPGELRIQFQDNGTTPTKALVDEVLQAIAYVNSSDNPPASVQIDYMIDDGAAGVGNGSLTVTITPVNDPPTATNMNAAEAYTEDTPLDLIDIVITDLDSANVTATLTLDDLTAGSLSTATSNAVTSTWTPGTGVWSASGALADVNVLLAGVMFNPALNYNGDLNIATSVDDGVNPAVTGSKTVTGTADDDAPTATNMDAAESYTEDVPLNLIDIVISDVDSANVTATMTLSDVGAGSLSTASSNAVTSIFVAGVWTASGALADVNALLAGITFNPALDYNANFTIATSVDDGTTTINGNKAMTGTAVSDSPVLDLDADDSSTSTGADFNTTFTEAGGAVLIADADAILSDVDGGNLVSLFVTLTNPLDGVSETLAADTTGTSIAATYNSGAGLLTLSGADSVANYQQVLRTVTFDNSSRNPNVTDRTITFIANDGTSGSSVSTTTVTINAINDAPVNSVPAAQSVNEDTALVFSSGGGNAITISDVDAGGADMAVTLIATNGTLTLSGTAGLVFTTGTGSADAAMVFTGTIANINAALEGMSFVPTPDFNGAASVQIITDDQGNTGAGGPLTVTDTVNITVNAVNDAPTAPDSSITTAEDSPYLAALGVNDLLINSNDVDGGTLAVSTTPSVAPSNGLLILSSDGTFTYTPNADFNGTDAFTYEITDGNGGTVQATVMIDVTPVNDAPFVPGSSITLDEDASYAATLGVNDLLINSIDVDGDALTVSATPVVGPTNGVLILSATGTLTYTPNADFNGTDAFTYEVTDGNGGITQAVVTITVNPINDAPVASALLLNARADSAGLIDGGALIINDTDVDGDALTLVGLTQPSNGFVSLNPDGTIVYLPTTGFVGIDSFTYTVSDPSGAQATGLVVIDVVASVGSEFGIGASNGAGINDGGRLVLEPLGESAPTEEEPEAAETPTDSPEPTVSVLVTPDGELSSDELPAWIAAAEKADLLLLVGSYVNDSEAEILGSQAGALYAQTLRSAGGYTLDRFEFVSLDPASLAEALETLRRGLGAVNREIADNLDGAIVVQISTGLGAAVSIGVVSYILRGGTLAATLLSSVPMWKGFDPLPMLMGQRKPGNEAKRLGDDDEETVSTDSRTDEVRELHLESMFSSSAPVRPSDPE